MGMTYGLTKRGNPRHCGRPMKQLDVALRWECRACTATVTLRDVLIQRLNEFPYKVCTGRNCGSDIHRQRRAERLHEDWQRREAKRPPLAERLVKRFKDFYKDGFKAAMPQHNHLWWAFLSPEDKAAAIAERQRMEDARCARLPKIVIQDDAWRARYA